MLNTESSAVLSLALDSLNDNLSTVKLQRNHRTSQEATNYLCFGSHDNTDANKMGFPSGMYSRIQNYKKRMFCEVKCIISCNNYS